MPDTSGGKVTAIPSFMTRLVQGARYVISGAGPDAWFGPMQPLQPMAPPEVKGRQWNFPVGSNLNYTPRTNEAVSFDELRALADNLPILRLVIESRKDQVAAMKWLIKPRGMEPGRFSTREALKDPRIAQLLDFFQSPDRQNGFDVWLRPMLEDLFVIDAMTLYPRMTRGGGVYGLDYIDGATIKPLIGADGRAPMPPDPAFQQILHGIPAADFSSDELMYLPRNRRTNRLYGFSPVEQIILTVNTALRREVHTLNYYKEGTLPDSFGTLPKEWTNNQIEQFQAYFDSLMTDNLADRRKLRFMPEGFKFQEVKQPPLKDQFDEWIARIVCYAFSIPPNAFVHQVNRATADNLTQQAQMEGLVPIQNFLKSVFDVVIGRYFGMPDLEWAWDDSWMVDPLKRAQADQIDIQSGVKLADEVRDERGLPPLPNGMGQQPPRVFAAMQAKSNADVQEAKNESGSDGGEDPADKVAKSAPVAAGICFMTSQDEALFLKRAEGCDLAGYWCLPGGKVEDGETPREAAVREAGEEADTWSAFPFDPARLAAQPDSLTETPSGGHFATYVYRVDAAAPVMVDESESSEAIWCKIDDPPQPLHPGVAKTLPVLIAQRNGAVEKYSPNQPRDDHGRFGSTGGAAGTIRGRRRKPKEVAGAKWDATTPEGVRVEAAVKTAKAAALGVAAYYASKAVGKMQAGGWKTAAGYVITAMVGTSIHWALSSVHALLEQAADALGMPREHADRAVEFMRGHVYTIVDSFIPPSVYKAAGADADVLRLLDYAQKHAHEVLGPGAEALKAAVRAQSEAKLKSEQLVEIDQAVDSAQKAVIEAISAALYDLHSGKAEKLAKAQEGWPAGKAPKAKHERNLRRLWEEILAEAAHDAAKALRGAPAEKLAKAGTPDVEMGAWEDEVAELVADAAADGGDAGLKELFDRAAEPARAELRTAVFRRANDRAQEWARQRAAELVSGVEETTRTMLRSTITKGLADGLSIDEIADQIQESAAFSDERAELIAQTEVSNANSHGALEGYKAAEDEGLAVRKRWVIAVGACPLCQENEEAGAIALDAEFPNGAQAPAQHPRCRCALSAELGEEE